jgi:hypothetical protein
MKRLMVFFLLIPFFLPFPAEGSTKTLKIGDRNLSDISENTGAIVFRVTIKGYEGNLWEFGFDVIYDSDILEYIEYTGGHLHQDTRYSFINVTRIDDNTLRVTANGYHITTFDYTSGDPIVALSFLVKKYEETTLRLANPAR